MLQKRLTTTTELTAVVDGDALEKLGEVVAILLAQDI